MRFKYLFIVLFSIVSVSSFFSQVSTIDFQLAKKYYLDSDYEKAALYYEKIFKESEHRLKIYENYKSTFIELNKFKEAEKLIKTLIKENPNKLKFLVDLGVIYGLVDRSDKKNQVFDKAIEQIIKETSYDNAFDLGLAFEKIGNLEKALEVYLNFESKNLLNPFAFHSKIALIYNKTGKTNKMINTFFEMLDFNNKFLQNVQNGLVNSIDFQNNLKEKEILRQSIIEKIQANPKKIVYIELLAWFYMLNNDYENAYTQIKALDKKLNKNGSKLLELGNTALNNQDFKVAIKCFDDVVLKSNSLEYKFEAKNKKLFALKSKILYGNQIIQEELEELKANYLLILSQLNNSKNVYNNSIRKYNLLLDLSEIEAFYLGDISSAKQHLNNAILIPRLKEKQKGNAKLKLANILVLEDNIWEASLMYLQIEKQFKDDQLGHLAKFKNAQVYYFSGEYDWCQAQLKVLKASTSKLIANDALELSVLISDNYNMDTSEVAMKLFSYADMLTFQQQFSKANILYDSILKNFKNHSLNDEIIFRKAKIDLKQHNYQKAIEHFKLLIDNYPNSILLDNSLFLIASIYEEKIKDFDQAKKYFKTILFDHKGSLYAAESRKRFRKLAGSTNEKIEKDSG
ncbi:MAG: tetratricopeptide repeat protein [Flavobacteriales bacterium]|nr:tetratricopeptide repeat protein [Flavobacteriales bacterium]MBL6868434.1 tetratricopeptide repeat protein [Flavobacteriales bacterium]